MSKKKPVKKQPQVKSNSRSINRSVKKRKEAIKKAIYKIGNTRKYTEINVEDINFQKYNPSIRTLEKKLGWLVESIVHVGMIIPIVVRLVDGKWELIDGHRRVAVHKIKGWKTILAVIDETDIPIPTLYAEINKNVKSHTGNEEFSVWYVDPTAVTERARAMYDRYQKMFGRALIDKLYHTRKSIQYFAWAIQARNFLAIPEEDLGELQKIAHWLIDYKGQSHIRFFLAMGKIKVGKDQRPIETEEEYLERKIRYQIELRDFIDNGRPLSTWRPS